MKCCTFLCINNTAVNIEFIKRFRRLRVIQKRYSKIEMFTKKNMIFTVKQMSLSYRLSAVKFYFVFSSSSRYPPEKKRAVLSRCCYFYRKWKKNQSILYSGTLGRECGSRKFQCPESRTPMHPFALLIIFRGNYTCHWPREYCI